MAAVKFEFDLSSTECVANLSNDSTDYALYVNSTSEGICSLIILVLLILVVCVYKAYKTTLQRLILYHIIFSLLCELPVSLFFAFKFSYPLWTCAVIFYLSLYTLHSWIIYTTFVTNCLFIFTLRLIRGSPIMWRYGKVAECICVCSALVGPFAYFWILILDGHHRPACEGTKSSRISTTSIIFDAVYVAVGVEIVFVSVTMCCVFCALRRRMQSRQLINLLKHLLCYTLVSAVLVVYITFLVVLIPYFYFEHPSESLHVTVNLFSSVFACFVLISTIVISLLAIQPNCKRLCGKICCKKADHRRQQVDENVNETQGATNPTSHPINQPSHTYFSIPYTGAFTHVSVNEEEGERTPLI